MPYVTDPASSSGSSNSQALITPEIFYDIIQAQVRERKKIDIESDKEKSGSAVCYHIDYINVDNNGLSVDITPRNVLSDKFLFYKPAPHMPSALILLLKYSNIERMSYWVFRHKSQFM